MKLASGCNSAQAARWRLRCQNPIYGKSARSFNENGQSQRDGKQMKFIAFAWLFTAPIHKEANPAVYHQNSNDHLDNDAYPIIASDKSDHQPQSTLHALP